jgi:hypothetical protein
LQSSFAKRASESTKASDWLSFGDGGMETTAQGSIAPPSSRRIEPSQPLQNGMCTAVIIKQEPHKLQLIICHVSR